MRQNAGNRVLVVNDNADQLLLMKFHLEQEGYHISTATSGLEGLQRAKQETPDLIISDVLMPDMTGIELCRLLRLTPQFLTTPVLLVSALCRDYRSVIEGLQTGADDYLKVPYDPLHLVAKAARMLERKVDEDMRLAAIVNSSADAIIGKSLEGIVFSWNESAQIMYGYSASEAVGRHFSAFVPPAYQEIVNEALGKVKYGETIRSLDIVQVRKDGTLIDVSFSISPILGAKNQIIGISSIARDITEQRRLEKEAKKSEEQYRDLIENARDIIYTHDLEGKITSVNKACEQVTGYRREEIINLNQAQFIAPEYLEKAYDMFNRKLAGEQGTTYELEIIAKNGRHISVEVSTNLIFQDGFPVGVQGIARDITERKHLEEQLRQSQRLEAIGQLTGGIAHDFNNLLTGIIGYSQFTLMKDSIEEPLRGRIEEVKKAGERAAALISQLLVFSRKQVLQSKILDLNFLISEIEKMLQRVIGEDIELRTNLAQDLGFIKCDPGQIEQVLMNLVINARDAMPEGGRLTVETRNIIVNEAYGCSSSCDVQPGEYIELCVSDSGIGMDMETQKHMFEPFFTTKEVGKGTGLGLSTVYGIVKQSRGYIWAYSEVGRGTTFTVYLPRVKENFMEMIPTPEPQLRDHGTETILLAEDAEVVRHLLRDFLQSNGYSVLEAVDGNAAELICEQYEGPIHIVITDVVMPLMSGPQLKERLAKLRPDLKVLFMSGYTGDMLVRYGIRESDISFLQKPFAPALLLEKIRELLKQEE